MQQSKENRIELTGPSWASRRRAVRHPLSKLTTGLERPLRHLGREGARRECVHSYVIPSPLDRELAGQGGEAAL